MDLPTLKEIKELFENSSNKFYRFGMFKDSLGYHQCYDFIKEKYVYCASLSYPEALKLVKKYITLKD